MEVEEIDRDVIISSLDVECYRKTAIHEIVSDRKMFVAVFAAN